MQSRLIKKILLMKQERNKTINEVINCNHDSQINKIVNFFFNKVTIP